MKISRFLLTLAAVCGFTFALWRCPAYADTGSGSAIATAGSGSGFQVTTAPTEGSGSAVAPAPHSDQLPDPAKSPLSAISTEKVLWHYGWAFAFFGGLVMVGWVLVWMKTALAAVPLLGKVSAWLSVGKRAVLVAGLPVAAAAAYNALVEGGTWFAALILLGGKLIALMNFGGAPASQPS